MNMFVTISVKVSKDKYGSYVDSGVAEVEIVLPDNYIAMIDTGNIVEHQVNAAIQDFRDKQNATGGG